MAWVVSPENNSVKLHRMSSDWHSLLFKFYCMLSHGFYVPFHSCSRQTTLISELTNFKDHNDQD